MISPHNMSHVIFHMSSVTCQMSCFTCHMSCVTCNFFSTPFLFFSFWTKWWSFCLFIIILMLCLPDASWGFLELSETSWSFWTLPNDSICFLLLPVACWLLLTFFFSLQDCHNIKTIINQQKYYSDSESHKHTLK